MKTTSFPCPHCRKKIIAHAGLRKKEQKKADKEWWQRKLTEEYPEVNMVYYGLKPSIAKIMPAGLRGIDFKEKNDVRNAFIEGYFSRCRNIGATKLAIIQDWLNEDAGKRPHGLTDDPE